MQPAYIECWAVAAYLFTTPTPGLAYTTYSTIYASPTHSQLLVVTYMTVYSGLWHQQHGTPTMPSHHHHLIYTFVYTCVVVFEFARCPAAALLHFPNCRCPVRTRAMLEANNIKKHHNIEKHGRHRTRGVNALPVRNPLLWWPSMLHFLANNPRQPCHDTC